MPLYLPAIRYSKELYRYSVPYKTFNQVLHIRTVTSEYLIAMKLRSARQYKNDLSDIVGILNEHQKRGEPITFEQVDIAVKNLYGGWDDFEDAAIRFIKDTFANGDYERLYAITKDSEKEAKGLLVQFESDYPKVLKTENVSSVLKTLRAKRTGQNKTPKHRNEHER